MTLIHFIRHGETIWHASNKYAGNTDIEITEKGKNQALGLKKWNRSKYLTRIYSSDLSRSIETALPLARDINKFVCLDSRLREVNFGDVEGMDPMEMGVVFPELRAQFIDKPADTKMPNGESGREAVQRALPALKEMIMPNSNDEIAIFCHGTLLRLLTCYLLRIELNEYRRVFQKLRTQG